MNSVERLAVANMCAAIIALGIGPQYGAPADDVTPLVSTRSVIILFQFSGHLLYGGDGRILLVRRVIQSPFSNHEVWYIIARR